MQFEKINKAYNRVFQQNALSLGVVVPIESYTSGPIPTMETHLERVKKVERLGFKSIWLRDIPFNVPNFGDAGQTYDPFTYLGFLAGQTSVIALGVSSIALPLHHPLHVAKSAATIDQLSQGRLLLGVASGDRFDEYPAMGIDYESRGALFRDSFHYIRNLHDAYPTIAKNNYGQLKGNIDMLPKSTSHKIPLLMTGSSRQTLEWNVNHADGWMNYPRDLYNQNNTIRQYRELIAKTQKYDKPFMQPMYLDLQEEDDYRPQPIQLGYRLGVNYLVDYLDKLRSIGVNHLALNLRFNALNIDETLERIAEKVLPEFHSNKKIRHHE
ncbi:LLM class oxidoreductase [Algibacter mikhailovii]|uniref:N5,N10-methylene tetrahydromethanopterin reductase n=1 Tax=Algibacter mikhailovii TaxID=425498 RepID=A0A918V4Z0_9FLAO|nr:LLM class oxidoreductase [Algibacter mikhailovii]GGZ69997.1 N5,N10-methylene tetrahydromethanopterin reductase [Algibacter mikhailovii]